MMDSNTPGQQWERQTLQKVLLEHIREQRRARRWNVFFKLLILVIILLVVVSPFIKESAPSITTSPHTALIDIKGEIDADQAANSDDIRTSLEKAYKSPLVKGVILRINSPGGSPVQAREIYDAVNYFRAKRPELKVYAVIEDLGASAAYLVASVADEIYANEASLVGSIGARLGNSFGFVEVMKKIGIDRRIYATGKHKVMLDPFLPEEPEEVQFVHEQLDIVLGQFLENVKQGRGDRLKMSPDVYSGYIWSGVTAKEMGLIDGFGDTYFVAREVVKTPNLVDYSVQPSLLDRLANRIGASFAASIQMLMALNMK